MCVAVSVLSLGAILFAILLVTLVMNRLRLPFILGVLLAGILLGPNSPLAGIHVDSFDLSNFLIRDASVVDAFASIGAVLILFEIGLSFSLGKLRRLGLSAVFAAFIKIGFVFLLGFLASKLFFGFSTIAALFIGVILSMSSTPIIIKILREKNLINRPEVPFIVTILVIEDLFAVFSLAVLTALQKSGGFDLAVPLAVFKVAVAFLFVYIILSEVLKRFVRLVAYSDEALLLTALAVTLGVAYASEGIGLSATIGAFLAGSVLASLPEAKRIEDAVKPFAILFSALFFFSIGMLVNISAVAQNLWLAFGFILIAFLGKYTGAGVSAYFTRFRGPSSAFVGIAMLTLSEVSLLVAQQGTALNVIDLDVLSISSAVLFVSVIAASLLITRERDLYALTCRIVPGDILAMGRRTADGLREIRAVFTRPRQVTVWRQASLYDRILSNALASAIFAVAAVLLFILSLLIAPFGMSIPVIAVLVVLELAAFLCILLAVLRLKKIMDLTIRAVMREEGTAGGAFMRDLLLSLALVFLTFLAPLASAFIPPIFAIALSLVLLLIALFYVHDASIKAKALIENNFAPQPPAKPGKK